MMFLFVQVLDVGDTLSLQVVANFTSNNMLLALIADEDALMPNEGVLESIPPHLGDITVIFVREPLS